jgi:hypothetical protein
MSMKKTAPWTAVAVAMILMTSVGQAAVISDPAADWVSSSGTAASVVGGTAAGWSYWRAGSLAGSKTALVQSGNTGDVGGPGFAGINTTSRALPAVQGDNQNGGQYELFWDGDINNGVAGTDLLIHPDSAANTGFIFMTYTFSVADLLNGSQATIAGSFRNLVNSGNGVNAYVLHNTATLFSATPTGTTLTQSAGTFNIVDRTVAAGDTISFVVDWNGDRAGDETALRGSISLIPEPASGLLLLGAAAGLGVLRRKLHG